MLPLLKFNWQMLFPCGDVITTCCVCLADVIANVVAVVIATNLVSGRCFVIIIVP